MKINLAVCAAVSLLLAASCGRQEPAAISEDQLNHYAGIAQHDHGSVADRPVHENAAHRRPGATATIAKGVGVVTAIDSAAAEVTITHEPITALGWPAGTRTFKVAPGTRLDKGLMGRTATFELRANGMDGEVVTIRAN